jgi:hypothetical protein
MNRMRFDMRIFKNKCFDQWAKNVKVSVNGKELEGLKDLVHDYLSFDEVIIKKMLKKRLLIEVSL